MRTSCKWYLHDRKAHLRPILLVLFLSRHILQQRPRRLSVFCFISSPYLSSVRFLSAPLALILHLVSSSHAFLCLHFFLIHLSLTGWEWLRSNTAKHSSTDYCSMTWNCNTIWWSLILQFYDALSATDVMWRPIRYGRKGYERKRS
jgi:hypothetical protein